MTSRDFCYWLQGYFEISQNKSLGIDETAMIKKHLDMVFVHEIDPSHGDAKAQHALNKIHNQPPPGPTEPFDPSGPKIRC